MHGPLTTLQAVSILQDVATLRALIDNSNKSMVDEAEQHRHVLAILRQCQRIDMRVRRAAKRNRTAPGLVWTMRTPEPIPYE